LRPLIDNAFINAVEIAASSENIDLLKILINCLDHEASPNFYTKHIFPNYPKMQKENIDKAYALHQQFSKKTFGADTQKLYQLRQQQAMKIVAYHLSKGNLDLSASPAKNTFSTKHLGRLRTMIAYEQGNYEIAFNFGFERSECIITDVIGPTNVKLTIDSKPKLELYS